MKGEIDKREKLWYYDVPDWCIMLDKLEREFFYEESQQWSQIDFMRPPSIPKFWNKSSLIDFFSSEKFLTDFFWNLKKSDENIQIKIYERVKLRKTIGITDTALTKEELEVFLEYITNYGCKSCFLYNNDEPRKAIVFEPAEQMHIYLKEEDIPDVKSYLSKFAEETDYYTYKLGDLE